ncbi:hypothetical protein PIB30_005431 [Stylosanthes scabra]|uniref:Uncharacterized protein n=1 Tax=Stylosanthes scabra TaxID=79078 RepID=A0ABU6X1D9_9FABA|nr:hypothetical protein [Stylosanthes scabra]
MIESINIRLDQLKTLCCLQHYIIIPSNMLKLRGNINLISCVLVAATKKSSHLYKHSTWEGKGREALYLYNMYLQPKLPLFYYQSEYQNHSQLQFSDLASLTSSNYAESASEPKQPKIETAKPIKG